MKTQNAVTLLLNSARGTFIPKNFASDFNIFCRDGEGWKGISQDMLDGIADRENELYWECWDDILNSAYYEIDGNRYTLYQDGDLWALCYEIMTDEEKENFGFVD